MTTRTARSACRPVLCSLVAAAATLSTLAGCVGGGGGGDGQWVNGTFVESKYRDPIQRSALRERAVDLLLDATTASDPQTRANALEALTSAPARLETVIGAGLRDSNEGVRSVAAQIAGRERLRGSLPGLESMRSDPSIYAKLSAIYGLASIGSAVDQTPLASALLDHPSTRVRAHAAFLLGELGNASARGLLTDALTTDMPRAGAAELKLLQLQIAEALIKLGDEEQVQAVRAALYPSRPEELEATALAVQIIGEVRDRASIDELIYISAYTDEGGRAMPAEVRLAAALSLAKLGERRGDFIADEYRFDPSAAIRAQAAFVYGETGRLENLPKVENMLDDPDPRVRVAAAASAIRTLDIVQSRS